MATSGRGGSSRESLWPAGSEREVHRTGLPLSCLAAGDRCKPELHHHPPSPYRPHPTFHGIRGRHSRKGNQNGSAGGRGSRAPLRGGRRGSLTPGVDRRRTGPRPSTLEYRTYLARGAPETLTSEGPKGPKRAESGSRRLECANTARSVVLPRRVSVVYIWVRRSTKLQSYASGKPSRQSA
jgi:hypothetical protein